MAGWYFFMGTPVTMAQSIMARERQIAKKYLPAQFWPCSPLFSAIIRVHAPPNREDDVGSYGSQDPARSCNR